MDVNDRALSRRRFLGTAGAVSAATTLGPLSGVAAAKSGSSNTNGNGLARGRGGTIPESRIGMQLFTVRDLLANNELDLPGTFEVLADAGYALVEVGGTYDGRTAAEFRALANSFGLEPEGSHVPGGGNAWRNNRAQIWSDAEALGLTYVGLASPPPGTQPTHASYAALAAEFNAWGAEARERGLKFYFHNHPGDFALDGGTPVYDTLLEETDPDLVFFELDIAWIEAGGQSAYDYIRRYGDRRFPLFHVKDLRWSAPPAPPAPVAPPAPRVTPGNVNKPSRPYWLTDVGKGELDFARILSALKDPREHVYHVERDDAPNDETADGSAPQPNNPAGAANTAWTSRKHLAQLQIRRG